MATVGRPRPRGGPSLPARSLRAGACRSAAGAVALAGLSLLAFSLAAAEGGAQPTPGTEGRPAVEGVRLRLDAVDGDAAPRVELEYRLRIPTGTREIPLHGLRFAGVGFGPVDARLDGRPVEVSLRQRGRLVRSATVPVPAGTRPGDGRLLRLTYSLQGPASGMASEDRGAAFDLAVPLLRVDWAPTESDEDIFRASVILPAEARLTERLPTVPLERTTEGEGAAYAFSLPAAPSLLRFRGRWGEGRVLTLGRWVDLGVLVLLAALGLAGWRASRRAEA